MPRLKMLRGPQPGLVIELTGNKLTIGRGRKNDIIIHDNEVSRTHCTLVRVKDDYEIHDLESTNGTFVNGQPLDEGGWLLSTRCIVELGDSITLQYMSTNDHDTGPLTRLSQPMEAVVDDVANYLVIMNRHNIPDVYALDSPLVTIGRDLNNDIVLSDVQVSRFHLRVVRQEAGYRLEDLNTLNGTFIDDARVKDPIALHSGQQIRLGTSIEMWYTHDPRQCLKMYARGDETATHRRSPVPTPTHLNGLQAGQLEEHIFIVYARSEWDSVVHPLSRYLNENGVPTFVEQPYLPDSPDWQKAMNQAQMECRCLIVVVSDLALEVPHVKRALRHFMSREKPILLIQYGDVPNQPLLIDNLPAVPYDVHKPQRTFRTTLAEIRKLNNTLLT